MRPLRMRAAATRHVAPPTRHSLDSADVMILLVGAAGRREDAMSRTRLVGSPAPETRSADAALHPFFHLRGCR